MRIVLDYHYSNIHFYIHISISNSGQNCPNESDVSCVQDASQSSESRTFIIILSMLFQVQVCLLQSYVPFITLFTPLIYVPQVYGLFSIRFLTFATLPIHVVSMIQPVITLYFVEEFRDVISGWRRYLRFCVKGIFDINCLSDNLLDQRKYTTRMRPRFL